MWNFKIYFLLWEVLIRYQTPLITLQLPSFHLWKTLCILNRCACLCLLSPAVLLTCTSLYYILSLLLFLSGVLLFFFWYYIFVLLLFSLFNLVLLFSIIYSGVLWLYITFQSFIYIFVLLYLCCCVSALLSIVYHPPEYFFPFFNISFGFIVFYDLFWCFIVILTFPEFYIHVYTLPMLLCLIIAVHCASPCCMCIFHIAIG